MNTHLRKDGQRILSLWFPHLPSDRIFRQRLGARGVQTRRPDCSRWSSATGKRITQRVAALDEQAEALRLKRGMGMADARAMHPESKSSKPTPRQTVACSKALPTGATATHPWSLLTDRTGSFSTLPAAPIFSVAKSRCWAMFWRASSSRDSMRRAGLASTPGTAWAAAPLFKGRRHRARRRRRNLWPLCRFLPCALTRRAAAASKVSACAQWARSWRRPARLLPGVSANNCWFASIRRSDASRKPISPRLPVPPLSVERHLADPIVAD